MDVDEHMGHNNQLPFKAPRKLSSNFQRIIQTKSRQTLTTTSNKFKVLTDDSDSDIDEKIGKIVKKKRKNTTKDTNPRVKITDKAITNDTAPVVAKNKPSVETAPAINKKMSLIVVNGKTVNLTVLIQDLKTKIKEGFSVKHTNNFTILFLDKKEDHLRVLQSR